MTNVAKQDKQDISLEKDILYIKNDIVTQQPNGNYMKFSRLLQAVTIDDMPRSKFVEYWTKRYSNKEDVNTILEVLNNHLDNELTSIDEMIELVKASADVKS